VKVVVGLALAVLVVSASWSVIASLGRDEPPSVLPAPVTDSVVTTTTRTPTGASTSTSASGSSTATPASVTSTTSSSVPRFTAAEIATHSTTSSCWLVVDGRVYDVTTYLRSHPGGSRTITPWCGKESTVAFATEDGRGEHSTDAYAQLDRYVIGERAS
jgi:cytochrome b involved in lipid metabolism